MRGKKFHLWKIVIGGVVVVMGVVGAFYLLNHYIYEQKQADEGALVETYRATLTGEMVCLPHADTSGPQTMECVFGMRTDVGEHYAVDFALMSQEHQEIPTGTRFTANGMLTPVAQLSTSHWQKYDIEGTFSVTDSVTILK